MVKAPRAGTSRGKSLRKCGLNNLRRFHTHCTSGSRPKSSSGKAQKRLLLAAKKLNCGGLKSQSSLWRQEIWAKLVFGAAPFGGGSLLPAENYKRPSLPRPAYKTKPSEGFRSVRKHHSHRHMPLFRRVVNPHHIALQLDALLAVGSRGLHGNLQFRLQLRQMF